MVDEALIRQLAPQGLEPRGEPVVGWGWTDWPVRDARGRDLLVRVVGGIRPPDLGRALRGEARCQRGDDAVPDADVEQWVGVGGKRQSGVADDEVQCHGRYPFSSRKRRH